MSEQVLTVLKFCLLALIYLFLARVVWVVTRELRGTPVAARVAPATPTARAPRKAWRVVIVQPDNERGRDQWIDGEATIGRGGGCTISLPADTFVSQVHARIVDRNGQLFLEDLGSTNGTFLNGKQVAKSARVRKGDKFQIGQTVLRAERVKISAGAFSDAGRVRDNNEDAHVVDERLALFAIADGMGGHVAGEIASWTAIEALRAAVANGRPINDAITQANEAVIERSTGDPKLSGMGTTMTAVVVAGGDRLLVGHVGDSRAYFMHDGTLQQLTDDHSLVGELVREGRLTAEQAESHPQRAIVTRALGMEADVEVDVYTVPVSDGDRVIICSDGLTDMVRERDIERIARSAADPQRAAEDLVDAANSAGGVDNITVVVLDVNEVDEEAAPGPEGLVVDDAPVTPIPRAAPEVPPPAPAEPKTPFARRLRGALLLLIPLVVILGLAFGAVGWYARRSFYVGLDDGDVVVYRGVPGGVLGWDPTIEERSDLTAAVLLPVDREAVADGAARGSKSEADQYLVRLQARVDSTSTTTTTTTTTTTVPLTTTVPALPPVAPAPGVVP